MQFTMRLPSWFSRPFGVQAPGNRAVGFLELQFQRELDLPRRPEVSGREPCALNDPKGSAGRRQHWIAKIRVVENVEHFGAELHVEPLGYLRVFGHRKIGVQEVRSDNRISPKGPGMTGAGNDGP